MLPLAGMDGETIDLQIYLIKRMGGEICKLKNNKLKTNAADYAKA